MTEPVRRRTFVQLALASGGGLAANLLGGQAVRAAGSGDAIPEAGSLRDAFPPRPYSPYAGRSFATNVYWGDTHLHTAFSMDAGAFGARLTPRDAYRFAKGEELISATRQPVRSRARSISSSSPTIPTAWASSRGLSPATPRFWPTRTAGDGTT